MPAAPTIAEESVRENLARAVGDVFAVMLDARPVPVPAPGILPDGLPAACIVGSVGFDGDLTGLLRLAVEEDHARLINARLLATGAWTDPVAEDEQVNDAVGELTSMVAGRFKAGLATAGHACSLTLPSILRGHNCAIEPVGSASRHGVALTADGRLVIAEVLFKGED